MLKLLWIPVIFLLVGFAFLLGLSFGLSGSSAPFVNEAVPVLSMLGGWVSGIGALAAVITTLWLADKQRREDVENIRVSVRSAIADTGEGGWFIAVNLTSDGRRPVKVISLSVHSPFAKNYIQFTQFWWGSDSLPVSMSYGDNASLHLPPGTDRQIAKFVHDHCQGRVKGLKFVVGTTLREFEGAIHKNLLTLSS
ncbi:MULTISPECIES: hypothetical protein [unclassified Pseudomonas]|uniref:hypothetical protein n=1 Tax=unclassified Pseudomonas TaxID=196821 RepID=UPI0021BB3EBD|nr:MULTISPECIES: hypothetical protein [unclassified Pseudomonas]MCT8165643.1 hypothetical protein [Pseudomonas sp. HD6422]MCT8183607.1 hypothetical protein [Pseudomonas sp. HD6421]